MQFGKLLRQWLDSSVPNTWICDAEYEIYVRKGYHILGGAANYTLDIANVTVKTGFRGRGIFSSMLSIAERLNPFAAVYVESIQNPILGPALERRGYILLPNDFTPCYYKMKTHT